MAAALAFRCDMQSEPETVGHEVLTDWVEKTGYPMFCAAWSVVEPPPWKDFSCELKFVMPKNRRNRRRDGKRIGTARYYLVPDPMENVVALDAARTRSGRQ